MPGIPELLIILAIVLLVFGAGKLPAIGEAFGKTIKSFRKATADEPPAALAEGSERPALPAQEIPSEPRRA